MRTTSEIKDFLWTLCHGVVSYNVYTTSKPRFVKEGIKDFVVVNNPGYLEDITDFRNGEIMDTIGMIELYVKNEASIENTAKLHEMESALINAINNNTNEFFNITSFKSFSAPSFEDFNIVIFTINIIAK